MFFDEEQPLVFQSALQTLRTWICHREQLTDAVKMKVCFLSLPKLQRESDGRLFCFLPQEISELVIGLQTAADLGIRTLLEDEARVLLEQLQKANMLLISAISRRQLSKLKNGT